MNEVVETSDIGKAEMTPHMAEGIRLALEAMQGVMEFIDVNDDRGGGTFVGQDVNEFLDLTYSKCARAYQALSEDINIQQAHRENDRPRTPANHWSLREALATSWNSDS